VRRLGNSRLSEALISEKMTWLKTWNVYNIYWTRDSTTLKN